ncbi:hypothetical protein CDD83_10316 [Cordyceps sp. RAO-2017]|nr:hypothetical protein CDD83_10316 [Cordyceps sp. RAO-2017]
MATTTLAALSGAHESSQDELSAPSPVQPHAAIASHYHSLKTRLSAFDQSSCESLAWTQKYAPTTAAQVLQAGKETVLLEQWLQALKLQSVEGGSDPGGDKGRARPEVPSKRRRRKAKLQGFVVDSEDEANEMDELSELEDDHMIDASLVKRSVIRGKDVLSKSSRNLGKLRNTVVISGPHGCGKTAAVYAVAKETGFEVFEINSGSRRSGRDILEKVGDMTQNHQVQQHRAPTASAEGETDEVSKDLQSGAQGTMTSFFKPKSTTKGKQQSSHKSKEKPDKSPPKAAAPKSQKQSLILLEEADVLYEEDKQFWTTLMGMMMQSKRPFVVTCNDENLIPMQSLNLHGIFRFSPALAGPAVDLCLLIAANEGHALKRTAVESLYRSRGNDLRATISELNYWCQIGIGDRKGGFDWFYPRWPKGSDVDERGHVT